MCSFIVWKNACLNYREFDLEGDIVEVPHTWYLSAQSFITLLKLVWRELDNENEMCRFAVDKSKQAHRIVECATKTSLCKMNGASSRTWLHRPAWEERA